METIHLVVSFTALIVRFLTKRFIGDYEANTGRICIILTVHAHIISVISHCKNVEIATH